MGSVLRPGFTLGGYILEFAGLSSGWLIKSGYCLEWGRHHVLGWIHFGRRYIFPYRPFRYLDEKGKVGLGYNMTHILS